MSEFWERSQLEEKHFGDADPTDTDAAWIAVTGGIGFANASGSDFADKAFYDGLAYRIDAEGWVHIRGTITKPDSPVQFLGSPIITMPVGYRCGGGVQTQSQYTDQAGTLGWAIVTVWDKDSALAGSVRMAATDTSAVGILTIDIRYLAEG